jgi:hypothetical protein
LDIRAAPYSAKGDGVRNHGYVTTAKAVEAARGSSDAV